MNARVTFPWPERAADVLSLWTPESAARNAAWRAALVAREMGVGVRLLHGAITADAAQALRRLANGIREHMGVDVRLEAAEGDPLRACVQASRDASVLVIGSARVNSLRAWVMGTQAERLIRLSAAPVLVVKRDARAGYRRVLVPLDLDADGRDGLRWAASIARAPLLEAFHALGTRDEITLRVADVPESDLRADRQRRSDRSRSRLQESIDAVVADRARAVAGVGFGDPARLVVARAQAMRADVVIIGKRRRGLLADFFLGGVTQRVLAETQGDVLVWHRPIMRHAPGPRPLHRLVP